jgi:acyl dehydratase
VASTAPIDFHALRRGNVLPPVRFSVNAAEARAYLGATGETPEAWDGLVPPLALGALTLAGLMTEMPLPAGALHGGQEFEFLGTVALGEAVEAELTVAQQSERQGTNIVVFASELRCGERVVVRGRTTVMAPAATSRDGASEGA